MASSTIPSTSALNENDPDLDLAALPFTFADPQEEISRPLVRDFSAINHVAGEAWKYLRLARARLRSSAVEDLSMLPGMHIDIVLEILGYLHPLELVQVSRINKSFRDLLEAPMTNMIWRKAFLIDDDPDSESDSPDDQLPQCPSYISGRHWTKLLFGPQTCWECGKADTEPDYIIWRRVCRTCAEGNLVDTIPGYDVAHELNSTVHRTMLYANDDQERGKLWLSDGLAVAAQYEASTEKDHFIEEQHALVAKNSKLANECESWAWNTRVKYRRIYADRLRRVTSSVLKRLISEGFDERDVKASSYDFSDCEVLYRKRRLTSKLWNRARPEAVECVIVAQTRRLKYERDIRVGLRKEAITATALIKLRTPVPNLQHAYYPPPHTIHTTPQFCAAFADAPAFIEAWANETQAHLVSLLPGAQTAEKPDFRLLDRATSVFTVHKTNTRSTDLAIGWREARAHLHWFQGRPQFALPGSLVAFNPRGSAVAAELATLLGMDPETATAADMDKANERFSAARQREEPDDYSNIPAWSCILCNDTAPSLQTQKNIKHHILDKHAIDKPVEGVHFVLFKISEPPHRRRVMLYIAGAHPERYRCNRCAQHHPHVVKLFSMRAIRSHVQNKHLVELSNNEADDWTEVELLAPMTDG
ncbi:F-box domain-containing protein [Mycena sanguinolenta]|uniref:F-box domain-containing protein n=1 Tax=Mycena sanguinolenta TaxID=230812 RepID=A0A8H6Y3H5_9AGAR|nr:F-box domain-containing protein [Mycena sanguinolenta]